MAAVWGRCTRCTRSELVRPVQTFPNGPTYPPVTVYLCANCLVRPVPVSQVVRK